MGMTRCPLCGSISKKKYALGRGIAAHLHAIHTPWKPTALSQKITRRLWERQQRQYKLGLVKEPQPSLLTQQKPPLQPVQGEYEPTLAQMEAWDVQVNKLVQELETGSHTVQTNRPLKHSNSTTSTAKETATIPVSYKDSLPPFLQAASQGNLNLLQQYIMEQENDEKVVMINQTDRHGSTAAHWAAGGGHLECLRWLLERSNRDHTITQTGEEPLRKKRRRDGKTCLHYAARNGHLHCVRYLVESHAMDIQQPSGDGTTPLHMACYGGHLPVIQYFVAHQPLAAHATNDWGCSAAHWVAMTINPHSDQVHALCSFLHYECGVDFGARQGQGHSALHKAAQRQNRHVLEWMAKNVSKEELRAAAAPDDGGHTPSEIWLQVGGDATVTTWMKSQGW